MGLFNFLKSAEEVNADYERSQTERECTPLVHQIDTSGSCQCGFFIQGEPGGTFAFVPNRSTRRRLQSYKRGEYVKSEEEIKRMKEQREHDEGRREVRERARLSRRQEPEGEPPVTVSLLVSSEERQTEDD